MANEEHLEILKRGVEVWNKWQEDNPDVRPDLRGTDLRSADLWGVNLLYTDLSHADLRNADLLGANLSGAKLYSADLSSANLHSASLVDTDLSRGNLSNADLGNATLLRVDLNDADLSGADMAYTIFGDVDLSVTRGLETVRHHGPSTISVDTIYKSKGKIPESFLRGAGVPDTFITQIPALVGALQPIEYYSCFISYSHKDEDFTKRLHSRMRDEHLRVWFAPEDMRAGRKVHEQIEEAIRYYDKLLLVLSEDSMDSQWVETEIYHSRQREIKEGRRVLFPIRLVDFETIRDWTCFDADTGRDMAREIREYYIPDFSNWEDHDSFETAFDRLLRDLKAEEEKPSTALG